MAVAGVGLIFKSREQTKPRYVWHCDGNKSMVSHHPASPFLSSHGERDVKSDNFVLTTVHTDCFTTRQQALWLWLIIKFALLDDSFQPHKVVITLFYVGLQVGVRVIFVCLPILYSQSHQPSTSHQATCFVFKICVDMNLS